MRTLNEVSEVVTGIGVSPEKLTVSAAGLETAEKYNMEPLLLVILISEIPAYVSAASVTVRAVMESSPPLVWRVNVFKSIIPDPGVRVVSEGLVPLPRVVRIAAGVAGEPVGTTPAAA